MTITRDRFNVPHVDAETREAGIWAAGWIAGADRRLLGEQARYNARVAAIDAPGLSAIDLISSLQNFQPSEQTEAEVAKQSEVLRRQGKEGRAVLRDIDTFISGINDHIEVNDLPDEPWTRNDVFAVNALKGQFLGQGGGDEARRTQFFSSLRNTLGPQQGLSVFNDLRQFKNPGNPTSVDGKFKYGHLPKRRRGNAIIDPGSFEPTPAVDVRRLGTPGRSTIRPQASNTLMITGDRSTTGNPLMVGGPQIGYFYPGLTYEIDMNAPGLRWRGATTAPFPGYLLIGRGVDFATTLTSSGGDIIDQFAERLCGGSDRMYRYKGKCRAMEEFHAGTLGRRAGQLPEDGARTRGRLRDGERQQGRDRPAALELRQGHRRPALLPPAVERPGATIRGRSSTPRRRPRRRSTRSTSTASTSRCTRAANSRSAPAASTRAC